MKHPIKRLTITDALQISKLEESTAQYPWSLNQIQSALAHQASISFGLFIKTKLCAYILGSVVLDEAEIWNFAVLPQYQQKGIGSQLLNAFLSAVKALGVERIFLEVRASNVAAIKCYHKFNFLRVGLRKDYYKTSEGFEDAVLMELKH